MAVDLDISGMTLDDLADLVVAQQHELAEKQIQIEQLELHSSNLAAWLESLEAELEKRRT